MASSIVIVFCNKPNERFIGSVEFRELAIKGGKAILDSVVDLRCKEISFNKLFKI